MAISFRGFNVQPEFSTGAIFNEVPGATINII